MEFEVPLNKNQVPLARKVPQVTGLPLVSQKFHSKTKLSKKGDGFPAFPASIQIDKQAFFLKRNKSQRMGI